MDYEGRSMPGMMRMGDLELPSYRLGKTLGAGSFGKVKLAEHVVTGLKVAIKILNRKKIKAMGMEEKVTREIDILRLLVHPHVLRLYEVVTTATDIYVITEYLPGGELFDYIVQRGKLHESDARRFFQQIICGMEYCHRNMVVHRDLKPENLLLDGQGNVKVADFGLSNIMKDGHFLKTSCGSPNYAAPEVISGKLYAGPEVDVWSCGVVLFALLCGHLPFDDENIPSLFKKIKAGSYTIPAYVSPGARDLISQMLVVDPLKRISMAEIRQHSWFLTKLPRYLAISPPNAAEQFKSLDPEALNAAVRLGFDRHDLSEALRKQRSTKATVTYFLLLDSLRSKLSSSQEDAFSSLAEQSAGSAGRRQSSAADGSYLPPASLLSSSPSALAQRIAGERKWQAGLQADGTEPLKAFEGMSKRLHELRVRWKKLPNHAIRCRWDPHEPKPVLRSCGSGSARSDSSDGSCSTGGSSDAGGSFFAGTEASSVMDEGEGHPAAESQADSSSAAVLRFEMQLMKVRDDKYLWDVQHVGGPPMLFLELCTALMGLAAGAEGGSAG